MTRTLIPVARCLAVAVLALSALAAAPVWAADGTALERLYKPARARVEAADYAGALALLDDASIPQGPRRMLRIPTNDCFHLIIADPTGRSSFIGVGTTWVGRFDATAVPPDFSTLVPFAERWLQMLKDCDANIQPQSAIISGERLIVDFTRYSPGTGSEHGFFAGISTSTLGVDWVYDHDDFYWTWTAGSNFLVMASGVSRAIVGLSLTNGAVVWENSEIRANWAEMASGSGVVLAAGQDTLAAFAENSGRLLWKARVPVDSMLMAGERLLVSSAAEGVSAFRAASGKRLWRQSADPPGEAPLLALRGTTVVAVAGNKIRYLDVSTGVIRSTLNIPGVADVEAVAAGTNRIHLRTGTGYVCLDDKGMIVHQMASPQIHALRWYFDNYRGISLAEDGYLIDHLTRRLLNVMDPVTVDDLLELRAGCRTLVKGEKVVFGWLTDDNPPGAVDELSPPLIVGDRMLTPRRKPSLPSLDELRELGRGLGFMLPAVLRAQAGGDSNRLHQLYMANMNLAMPEARLEMLDELRRNAGMLWYRPHAHCVISRPESDFILLCSTWDSYQVCDRRDGRHLYDLPDLNQTSHPIMHRGGDRLTMLNDQTGVVTCRDIRTGRVLWEKDLDRLPTPLAVEPDHAASPDPAPPPPGTNVLDAIIVEGGPDARRLALRPNDGSLLWNTAMDGEPDGSDDWEMSYAQGHYLALEPSTDSRPDRVHGIDLRDGRQRWTREYLDGGMLAEGRAFHHVGWFAPYAPVSNQTDSTYLLSILDFWTGRAIWTQIRTNSEFSIGRHLLHENLLIQGDIGEGPIFLKITELPAMNVLFNRSFASNEVLTGSVKSVVDGRIFLPSCLNRSGQEDMLIRDSGPVLVLDFRSGERLGWITAPAKVDYMKGGVLVGQTEPSNYIWGFDWNRIRPQLHSAPSGGRSGASGPPAGRVDSLEAKKDQQGEAHP